LIERMPVREVEVVAYSVVVAAKPLPLGRAISRDDVKLAPWPESSQLQGGFSKIDDVLNRGLIVAVSQNEPITASKLAGIGAGAGLPPTITAGMRALSIRVNEVIGVAGFVVPGSRVDVMVTVRQDPGRITRVVLSNVLVLTAGTRFDQEQGKAGQPIPSSVVTLLLTPEDAEKITLAQTEGDLMLTLRNPLDNVPTQTQGIRTAALMGEPAPPPVVRQVQGVQRAVARPRPDPKPQPPVAEVYKVEAIRAAKRTEEIVR
jgi:pilus assembly protein CpaB